MSRRFFFILCVSFVFVFTFVLSVGVDVKRVVAVTVLVKTEVANVRFRHESCRVSRKRIVRV